MTQALMAHEGRVGVPERLVYADNGTGLACGETVIAMPLVATNAAGGIAQWINTTTQDFLVTAEHIAIEAITTPGGSIRAGVGNPDAVATNIYHDINPLNVNCYNLTTTRSASNSYVNQRIAPGQAYNMSRQSGDMTGLRGFAFLKGFFVGDNRALGGAAGSFCPGRLAVPDNRGWLPYQTLTGFPAGEFDVYAPLAASDAGGGVYAWANPFPFAVMVSWLQVIVTTGSSGVGTFSAGVAANTSTLSATLLSGINSQTVQASVSALPATNSTVFTQQVVAAGQALTISRASGAMAGLTGWVQFSVLPLGNVINS